MNIAHPTTAPQAASAPGLAPAAALPQDGTQAQQPASMQWLLQGLAAEAAGAISPATVQPPVLQAAAGQPGEALHADGEPASGTAEVQSTEAALQALPAFVASSWHVAQPTARAAGAMPTASAAMAVRPQTDALQAEPAAVVQPGTPRSALGAGVAVPAQAAPALAEPAPLSVVAQLPAAPDAAAPGAQRTAPLAPAVPADKGAQPLVQALAQRIQWQHTQHADVATVRLDPPQMGSLEIRIRHDATGAIQVQLQATHAEVGRQLTAVVEQLRQELQQRSHDAQVTVAHSRGAMGGQAGDGQRQSQQQPSDEAAIGQALQAWNDKALT